MFQIFYKNLNCRCVCNFTTTFLNHNQIGTESKIWRSVELLAVDFKEVAYVMKWAPQNPYSNFLLFNEIAVCLVCWDIICSVIIRDISKWNLMSYNDNSYVLSLSATIVKIALFWIRVQNWYLKGNTDNNHE